VLGIVRVLGLDDRGWTGGNLMIRIYVALEGFDSNEAWMFNFETPRELATFLRKLGKGQLKRKAITRIFRIEEI
jgi:hypothetical protein